MHEETIQVRRSLLTLVDPDEDDGASLLALLRWARHPDRNSLTDGIGLKIGVEPNGTINFEAGGVQISNVTFRVGDTLIFHGDRFEVVHPDVPLE